MAPGYERHAKKHLGRLAFVTPIARSIIGNRLFHLTHRVDEGGARSTRPHSDRRQLRHPLGTMLVLPAASVDHGMPGVGMARPEGRFVWAEIGVRLTLQERRARLPPQPTPAPPLGPPPLARLLPGQAIRSALRDTLIVQLDSDSLGQVTRFGLTVQPGALQIRAAVTVT